MSKKRQVLHNDFKRFKCDVGHGFHQLRIRTGQTAMQVQNALNFPPHKTVPKIEQGDFDCIYPLFRLCRFYGKRPSVKFIDLTPDEKALFTVENEQ